MNVWISAPRPAATAERAVGAAEAVRDVLFAMGESIDAAAAFPDAAIDALRSSGLMMAPFGAEWGGADLDRPEQADSLCAVLRLVGGGDLSVGRLYEGHVNAVSLVQRYGRPDQVAALADAVRDGAMSAVWNAEGQAPLTLRPGDDGSFVLDGRKILASGAGSITRPLVTALVEGAPLMAIPRLQADGRGIDLSGWSAQGMRSSATGTIDLSGVGIAAFDLIGRPGDYKRQPAFSGGAWRFCAVQLGAVERLVDLFRDALVARGRDADPYQRQRIAACLGAAQTASLWVDKAARMVAAERFSAEEIVAYVGLTRMIVERAGLDVLEQVHRGAGLPAFIRPNPIERVSRDLATYLRQPAPDGAMADAAATVLGAAAPTGELWRSR